MRGRILKIEMKDYGNYLGRGRGCFYVSDKNRKKTEYRHFAQEIGECVLKDGNSVSVDALRDLALFNIDTYIMTRYDRIVGFLVNPEDNSRARTSQRAPQQHHSNTTTPSAVHVCRDSIAEPENHKERMVSSFMRKPICFFSG